MSWCFFPCFSVLFHFFPRFFHVFPTFLFPHFTRRFTGDPGEGPGETCGDSCGGEGVERVESGEPLGRGFKCGWMERMSGQEGAIWS